MWKLEAGGSVLAVSSPNENALRDEFMKHVTELGIRGIRAESGFDLRTLLAVISTASVVCGNDSGPRHAAVALGVPTCTLFGPEHPFEWHPYPRDCHPCFFVEELPCRRNGSLGAKRWCGLNECDRPGHPCLDAFDVRAVFEECRRVGKWSRSPS
jgi:heptosyltransferase-2